MRKVINSRSPQLSIMHPAAAVPPVHADMARSASWEQSLLAHQLRPALVLDIHGTILAANEGSLRLISPCTATSTPSCSLLGIRIADLGIVLLPGDPPIFWTWKEIFDTAIKAVDSTRPARRRNFGRTQQGSAGNALQETEHFWNYEAEHQSVVESDVYVTRHNSHKSLASTMESTRASSKIRARAIVRWNPSTEGGVFLVTFDRPSSPSRRAREPPTISRSRTLPENGDTMLSTDTDCACSCHSTRRAASMNPNQDPSVEEPMPSASDIDSSIIPYIMAIMDENGQVIKFSDSWYRLTGLEEADSLGSGWANVMHPDDLPSMSAAWGDVLQNERSNWTFEARFRSADASYRWFLIRTQPYKNASGKVLRWYGSMMDIHEWVVTRLEADRRRLSMLALFAQTDMKLWGIDTSKQMYMCEGRLDWDPSRIVSLMKHAQSDQVARTDSIHENMNHVGDRELVRAIRAALSGEAFSPIVEHWEGDRLFRTRLVTELASLGNGGVMDGNGVVQAALALTFDITNERARSKLQTENQRLVIKEKAAHDANYLKSRFLANVSAIDPFVTPVANGR